jgi:hypothetical protein
MILTPCCWRLQSNSQVDSGFLMGESIGPDVRRFKLVVDLARKALDLVYVTLTRDHELRAEHSSSTAVDSSSLSHHSAAASRSQQQLQQYQQQQYSIASQQSQQQPSAAAAAAAAVPYGGSIDAEWSLSVTTPQPGLAVPEPSLRRPGIGDTSANSACIAEQQSFYSDSLLTSAAWQQQQQQQQQSTAVNVWQTSTAQRTNLSSVVLLSPETIVMPQGIAGCGRKRGQVS